MVPFKLKKVDWKFQQKQINVNVSDVDSVLLRMTIIGVLLSFRNLAQEALNDVSLLLLSHSHLIKHLTENTYCSLS